VSRIKRGVTSHRRHKRVLNLTKGHKASRHSLFRRANESMLHALSYAFRHRRERKGDMRRLWITRVNAAARAEGMTYGDFMHGLKLAGVDINRKLLADMAVREPEAFSALVALAKSQTVAA
jgi:large subunit ribosomal protein L20